MTNVCLIVIDGWGLSDVVEGNAIANADTPVMDALCSKATSVTLDASGLAVGLPPDVMGNSEVGHITLGIGRALYQDLVNINLSIENKSLFSNQVLLNTCNRARSGNGRLHFLGLVSDGGVHSHIKHLFALLEAAKQNGVPECYVQYFSDGRDTSPTSGVGYVKQLLEFMGQLGYGKLATVVGRYYAMDRDKRFERIKIAFDGLVEGKGRNATEETIVQVIEGLYNAEGDQRQTDEFLTPIILSDEGRIKDGDTLVFIDYRADRMREIVEAFGIKPQFETDLIPKNTQVVTMTEYKKEFPFPVIFGPQIPTNSLAEWLASKKIPQFHCAETEKYAHVTFFFNGGIEQAWPLEDRLMVPSPKVATYDLQPEMNAKGVGEKMVEAIESGKYPFVMCNFAPPDMVGHTGVYEAAVLACQATDQAIGRIMEACRQRGYVMLVTSDHGNAEKMVSDSGTPFTAHTTNRVPFCMTGKKFREVAAGSNPSLADVAPTVLDLMGLDTPSEMAGNSLLSQ